MKKNLVLAVLSIFYLYRCIFAVCGNTEMCVYNSTGHEVYVQLYPVSMVFNGLLMYNLVAEGRSTNSGGTLYDYINGAGWAVVYPSTDYSKNFRWKLPSGPGFVGFEGEWGHNPNSSAQGQISYGVWKLEIQHMNGGYIVGRDSCLIEYDYILDNGMPGDLAIRITQNSFTYQFVTADDGEENPYPEIPIDYNTPEGYKIECWKPNGQTEPPVRNKIYGPSSQNSFFDYEEESGIYNLYGGVIPLDSRQHCNVIQHSSPPYWSDQLQEFPYPVTFFPDPFYDDERQGTLTLNLVIQRNVHTPYKAKNSGDPINEFWHPDVTYPSPIVITSGATLRLASNKVFTLSNINAFNPPIHPCKLIAKTNSNLILDNATNNGTKIIVQNNNWLTLEHNSNIYMNTQMPFISEVQFQPGGVLCDWGASRHGKVIFRFTQGTALLCTDIIHDVFDDSTVILIDSGAALSIPDNSDLKLDGNSSMLQVAPGGKLIFGSNAKLMFSNGARLKADNAVFVNSDSATTWDGIYLSDFANDTITNCVFQNAVNGINIQDKNYSVLGTPTVEISNCTFSNTTNTQLTNGVFVNNCSNVLIKDNEFTSTQLNQGFANSVMVEYCLPGSPVIVDNNIDKVLTGIFVVQSSPYIARNTITGVSASGKGIELDNANGTIKYNIINNFVNSYITLYSSPYLLKNTFSGASESNINLSTYSIPVMRPVNSGSTLSWLAGNNFLLGNPSIAGMTYESESYPSMDSGFNAINVNGSNYMSGEIPSSQDGELMATKNYWTDNPPASQKFSVSGGEVIYDPTFDGSTYPPTDYTELNDIGFGLYDTVFVETLGDNPSAENLFMQAYQKERNGQYLQAVNLYKQVVINHRNSSYAAVSLSRIFNCMEKRLSNVSEYQLLQSYMNQLKTSNIYPRELREIAEDFVIKAKVKQGLLLLAINDYETMYQQNQNNMKGIHALINKECLIIMLNDTNDIPSSQNSYSNITNHKLKLLSLIIGRDLTQLKVINNQIPGEYKLYQNYPNPFNPKTTIKYDLPKDGFITFKVYDVLGKELYSTVDFRTAGTHQITLDGSNYASGLYFYRIEAGSYIETKKMVLIK